LLLFPLLYVLALERPAEAEVVLDPTYCNGGTMDELCLGRAIVEANSADQYKTHPHYGEQYVIFLGKGAPIQLKSALPTVTTKKNGLYIIGDGAALTTISGPCKYRNKIIGHCDGFDGAPVFQVEKDAALVIESITVMNGDPGIVNEGSLYVYWSTIKLNGNHFGAAGITNSGPDAYLYLQDSTVNNNGSHHGPGGGISNVDGFVEIVNSTIHSNWVYTDFGGGGIANGLRGYKYIIVNDLVVYVKENGHYVAEEPNGGTISIANSTIYNNSDHDVRDDGYPRYPHAGGIVNDGTGDVWLGNVTITNNRGGYFTPISGSPDLYWPAGVFSSEDSGGLYFFNTIIAGNGPSNLGPDCYGSVFSLGGNLVGTRNFHGNKCDVKELPDLEPAGVRKPGDKIGATEKTYADPGFEGFGLLKDNGGNSCTVALSNKSPALNKGWTGAPGSHSLACAEYDQRGVRRYRGGWTCDTGAYEYRGQSTPSGLDCRTDQ
jgi:hypothetical protein